MITFEYDQRKLPIELVTAINEVHTLFGHLAKDIDQLPIITFDPLYTKPVNLTSVDIVQGALSQDIKVKIKLYTQNWWEYKYSPVNAYVTPSEPDTIYFNTRMFKGWGKTSNDFKETLLHELVHIFDKYSPYVFWHGKNNLKGKDDTAPVKLAKYLANLSTAINSGEEQLIW